MNAEFEQWWEAEGGILNGSFNVKRAAEIAWQASKTNQLIKNVETTAKEMESKNEPPATNDV